MSGDEVYTVGAQYQDENSWIVTIDLPASKQKYILREDQGNLYGWILLEGSDYEDDSVFNRLDEYNTVSAPAISNAQLFSSASELPEEYQAFAEYMSFNRTDLELFLNLTEAN